MIQFHTSLDGDVFEIYEPDPPQSPLDFVGALATLLVVTGNLELTDAANSIGLAESALILEAQAWAIGAQKDE